MAATEQLSILHSTVERGINAVGMATQHKVQTNVASPPLRKTKTSKEVFHLLTRLPPVIQDGNPEAGLGPLQRLHVAALAGQEQMSQPEGTKDNL